MDLRITNGFKKISVAQTGRIFGLSIPNIRIPRLPELGQRSIES